jgi:hypothetical protein
VAENSADNEPVISLAIVLGVMKDMVIDEAMPVCPLAPISRVAWPARICGCPVTRRTETDVRVA